MINIFENKCTIISKIKFFNFYLVHIPPFLPLTNRYIKRGAPIKEVNMPTGNTMGERIVLARISDVSKNTPPNKAEAGIRNRSSLPVRRRTIWGTTSPTKAIIPKNETDTAVVSEAINIILILSFSTFTPKLLAVSSPLFRALIFQRL